MIPVAVFLMAVGVLHQRGRTWSAFASVAVTALLVLAVSLAAGVVGVPIAVLAMAVLVSGSVALSVVLAQRQLAVA